VWNNELLAAGGALARAAYDLELAALAGHWAPDTPEEVAAHLTARALHALRFFAARTSTPSALVGAALERAFFGAAPAGALLLPSTLGPKPARDVRMPDARLGAFLPRLPVLPQAVVDGAPGMVDALVREGALKHVALKDVLDQLKAQPLTPAEGEAFVRWWVAQPPAADARARTELLGAARVGGVPLGSVQAFVDARKTPGVHIPLDGPLPPACCPPALAAPFRGEELKAAFGWRELGVREWLAHVLEPRRANLNPETDVGRDAGWAERVLLVLGKSWANVGKDEQDACAALLRAVPCVPTTAGLRAPGEAYFPSVSLFPDLPIVALTAKHAGVDKVLAALGVRRHVELQVVFDRMVKTGDWGVPDLVRYLVGVQGALADKEWKRLAHTAAFLAEGKAAPDALSGRAPRFAAGALYEPVPALREMGLPILDWGAAKWRGASDEGASRCAWRGGGADGRGQPASCSRSGSAGTRRSTPCSPSPRGPTKRCAPRRSPTSSSTSRSTTARTAPRTLPRSRSCQRRRAHSRAPRTSSRSPSGPRSGSRSSRPRCAARRSRRWARASTRRRARSSRR
jgi:hypothetical protein